MKTGQKSEVKTQAEGHNLLTFYVFVVVFKSDMERSLILICFFTTERFLMVI